VILVVDDDMIIARFLTDALTAESYDVCLAEDGTRAYDFLRRPDCELVLLDIEMPQINGLELLMVMQHEKIAVPVIVMTGLHYIPEEEVRRFPNVVSFLRKPFTYRRLTSLVQDILGKKSPAGAS